VPLDIAAIEELPALLGDALEDVLRELRYCAGGPGSRFKEGQIARAQDAAFDRGWLSPVTGCPNMLAPTDAGMRFLALHPADIA